MKGQGPLNQSSIPSRPPRLFSVMKSDGTVRVCGDYKLTVNKVSKLDGYPIPKLDDMNTKLVGGQTFTELDLSHAYKQMLVDENSEDQHT